MHDSRCEAPRADRKDCYHWSRRTRCDRVRRRRLYRAGGRPTLRALGGRQKRLYRTRPGIGPTGRRRRRTVRGSGRGLAVARIGKTGVRSAGKTALTHVIVRQTTAQAGTERGPTAWRLRRGSNDAGGVFQSVLEIFDFRLAAGTSRVPVISARGPVARSRVVAPRSLFQGARVRSRLLVRGSFAPALLTRTPGAFDCSGPLFGFIAAMLALLADLTAGRARAGRRTVGRRRRARDRARKRGGPERESPA